MMTDLYSTRAEPSSSTLPPSMLKVGRLYYPQTFTHSPSCIRRHSWRTIYSIYLLVLQSWRGSTNRWRFISININVVLTIITRRRYYQLTPNEVAFEKAIDELSTRLDAYDKILSKQKYVAGSVSYISLPKYWNLCINAEEQEITLADIYHIPYGHLLGVAGSDIMKSKPNVNRYSDPVASSLWVEREADAGNHRWFSEISARPSWAAVLALSKA